MATHSSVLAWRIPGTGEPGGLPSMDSHSRTQLKRLSSSMEEELYNTRFSLYVSLYIVSLWVLIGLCTTSRVEFPL